MKNIVSFILLIFISTEALAQPIYVGQPIYYELARTLQVAGKLQSKTSFTINNSASLPDMREVDNLVGSPSAFQFKILPVTLQTKFNSHHPYGWNDAGMIMAKGLQTQISGGYIRQSRATYDSITPGICMGSKSFLRYNAGLWICYTKKL